MNKSAAGRGDRTRNRLLDSLPRDAFAALEPHLQLQRLPYKHVLFNVGDRIDHVYFPTEGVVSLVLPLADGAAVEIGTVAREGVVGLSIFLGTATAPREAVVQGDGEALRLPADVALKQFRLGREFHGAVLQYIELYLEQVSQTAVCNARHTVASRCARWLLMMADRVEKDDFPMTQDFLAMLLGVRRAGVNAATAEFKSAGVISYTRGRVRIRKRDILEALACECHAAMRQRVGGFLA